MGKNEKFWNSLEQFLKNVLNRYFFILSISEDIESKSEIIVGGMKRSRELSFAKLFPQFCKRL